MKLLPLPRHNSDDWAAAVIVWVTLLALVLILAETIQ